MEKGQIVLASTGSQPSLYGTPAYSTHKNHEVKPVSSKLNQLLSHRNHVSKIRRDTVIFVKLEGMLDVKRKSRHMPVNDLAHPLTFSNACVFFSFDSKAKILKP